MPPAPVLRTVDDLWNQYEAAAATTASTTKPNLKPASSEPFKGKTYYELSYDDTGLTTLKYTVELHGQQPLDGYPLFIAFHGGGGPQNQTPEAKAASKQGNDGLWQSMSGRYIQSIKDYLPAAVYISCRGIEDTYDLHSRPKSYYLLRRLIRNLSLKSPVEAQADSSKINPKANHFVNPNLIYIIGFSAGGDGVYRLGSFLSDNLAAANMSAGHPGAVMLGNFANTALCLQVGEQDGDVSPDEYNRNIRTVEVGRALNILASANPGYYVHDVFMHPTKKLTAWAHNNWTPDELFEGEHSIIQNWPDFTRPETVPITEGKAKTCAVLWLNGYRRIPLPNLVIWDPSKPVGEDSPLYPTEWTTYRFRYWLAVRAADADALTPGVAPVGRDQRDYFVDHKNDIVAQYTKSSSEFWVKQTPVKLAIFINDKMVNSTLDTVKVFWGPDLKTRTLVWSKTVTHSAAVQETTLRMRGDPEFVFSAELHFDPATATVTDRNAFQARL